MTSAEAMVIFVLSIKDFEERQRKRSYKKPLKTKQILEILKYRK